MTLLSIISIIINVLCFLKIYQMKKEKKLWQRRFRERIKQSDLVWTEINNNRHKPN